MHNFSKRHKVGIDCLIVDEAGQVSLGVVSLVVGSLKVQGRIIVAGDSEQLAPILSGQYPASDTPPLFGSLLDCLMHMNSVDRASPLEPSHPEGRGAPQGTIVQLTENFRCAVHQPTELSINGDSG